MANQPQASSLQVAAVVGFYMSAALVMVFVNKAVLNSSPDLPLLFLFFQLIIAVVLLHASAFFHPAKIDLPKIDFATAKKLTPVVLVNIVGLVFNTLCLRDVEASFFQIARGLQLPLTIAVSSLTTRSSPSARVLAASALVTLGFLIGISPSSLSTLSSSLFPLPGSPPSSNGSHAPSALSLFYGVLSALFIAVHSVLIKSSLPHCSNSTIHLAYWTNLGSAAFLLPFLLFRGEAFTALALWTDPRSNWNASVFVWGTAVTGVFGFLLCVAGLLSIKVTSPITHMFSSAARSVLQTILGVWIFGDLLTINRASSIFVILIGTMFYTWVKHLESSQPRSSPSTSNSNGSTTPKDLKDREREFDLERGRLASVNEEDGEVNEHGHGNGNGNVLFDAEKERYGNRRA